MAWQPHQQQFYDYFYPYAQQASIRTGISPEVIFAQAALESAWGKSAPGYNYFGIKGAGGTQTTQEYLNGKWVTIKDSFRRYSSPLESIIDWGDFLGKYKRYKPVFNAQGAEAQARALGASGYATDPNYGSKLLNIIRGLPEGPPTMPGQGGIDWGSPYSLGKSLGDILKMPDFDIGKGMAGFEQSIEDKVSSTVDDVLAKIADPLKRAGFVVVALVVIAAALFLMMGNKPVVIQQS